MEKLKHITSIEDLRRIAKRKVPKMFFDYVRSGSWTESTLHANSNDFDELKFMQRVAINMEQSSIATSLIGQPYSMPLAIAPTGLTGMQYADGEILAAKAAEKMGVPFTLSTMSICSIEDVATNTTAPFWFQLYVMRDKEFIANLIARAKVAKCSALVLTLDLQVLGQRHRDVKNGLTVPPSPTIANMLDLLIRPEWCWNMLKTKRRTFGNIAGHVKDSDNLQSLSKWTASQFDPSLNWGDVDWIKQQWGGKLIIKGILDPDDARRAADCGADAIVVSNHGGRQLDSAPSSIKALPPIVKAVGDQTEVWIDSGIDTGQKLLKAIALGAKGAMVGKSFLYGLGAYGQAGVEKSIDIIAKELKTSMLFSGKTNIQDVDESILIFPDELQFKRSK